MAKKKRVPVPKKAKPKSKAKPKLKAVAKKVAKAKPRAKAVVKPKAKPKVPAKPKKVSRPKAVVVEAPQPVVEVFEVVAVEITYDAIARRAYEIWESKGRPEGDGSDNWAEAEAELRAGVKR